MTCRALVAFVHLCFLASFALGEVAHARATDPPAPLAPLPPFVGAGAGAVVPMLSLSLWSPPADPSVVPHWSLAGGSASVGFFPRMHRSPVAAGPLLVLREGGALPGPARMAERPLGTSRQRGWNARTQDAWSGSLGVAALTSFGARTLLLLPLGLASGALFAVTSTPLVGAALLMAAYTALDSWLSAYAMVAHFNANDGLYDADVLPTMMGFVAGNGIAASATWLVLSAAGLMPLALARIASFAAVSSGGLAALTGLTTVALMPALVAVAIASVALPVAVGGWAMLATARARPGYRIEAATPQGSSAFPASAAGQGGALLAWALPRERSFTTGVALTGWVLP